MSLAKSVIADLKSRATEKTKKTFMRHGHPEDRVLGVLTGELKVVAKPLGRNEELAYELYDSGYLEAMYLAGMIARGSQMPSEKILEWADQTQGMPLIYDYTVPWVAIENPEGAQLASNWVTSPLEHIASAGWSTYSGIATVTPDSDLDLDVFKALLESIPARIDGAKNAVKLNMNGFVIAVGTYVPSLAEEAKTTAGLLGVVSADVGDTDCKIPSAVERIAKAMESPKYGQKRKTIRC